MAEAPNLFTSALFDVEHAINMHAYSFVTLPPEGIYDTQIIAKHSELIAKCHIYMIGYTPHILLVGASQSGRNLEVEFKVEGEERVVSLPLPDEMDLKFEGEKFWLETSDGVRRFPNSEQLAQQLHKQKPLPFDVLYIGQSFGKDGKRHAIDRLVKHETLQRIALQKIPDGKKLQLILIEIQPDTRMLTVFNPFADQKDEDGSRVEDALDSLFGTTEAQQVSLYEAALIRYFQPKYNTIFKNSFPSTNLKVLEQCYDKDMAAVIAEFCIDDFVYYLCSDSVNMRPYHIAAYNIHDRNERDIFFGMRTGNLPNISD